MPCVRRPYLVLVLVCSGWATVGLVVRSVPLPGAAIACSRIWVAAVGLGVVVALRGPRGGPALFSRQPARLVLAGVVLGLHWLAFVTALQRAPIGTVTLIVFLGPVGVAVAAPRVLGERVGRATLVALAVAVAGFVLVAGPSVRGGHGEGLALAAAAGALYVVLTLASKPLAAIYGGIRLAFCEMVVAGLVLLPVGLMTGWGAPRPSWLWLVVLGLVHTAAAVSLYLAALARVPAVDAGILGYLEPAGAVVCGWLFLSERPGLATAAGGALIVAAGIMVVRSSRTALEPEVVGVVGS